MELKPFQSDQTDAVIELFTRVFGAAEGDAEGEIIGNLVRELIATTAAEDLIGCVSMVESQPVACIFLSRVYMPDARKAFILSPVAVATDLQRQGVGQALIQFGIDALKARGVNLLFTYGDPAYYCKTGFQPLSEGTIAAPFSLSYPHGWQVLSLDGAGIEPVDGAIRCVPALNQARYW